MIVFLKKKSHTEITSVWLPENSKNLIFSNSDSRKNLNNTRYLIAFFHTTIRIFHRNFVSSRHEVIKNACGI